MLQRNIKSNGRLGAPTSSQSVLFGLAFISAILCGLFCSGDTYAACADNDAACIEVNFGSPEGGNLSVSPGLSYYDSTQFYLPVEIGLKNTNRYTIRVYGDSSSLLSGSQAIPTIGTSTAYADLGKNGSEWGIRWNLGDTVEDKDTNYHKVPSSAEDADSIVVENQYLPKSSTIVKKQLTLGFAVAVDANQPSGSYTNTITVAVVASPSEARSFFDISTMQEMVPEICANTTTPNKTATTKFDTDGSHPEDPSYVPQTTLTDTRDGKTYLVRKLADGNCWMSQNLSLMLSTSTPLTSEKTDLNSKESWTPTNSTETSSTQTAWGRTDEKARSVSVDWNQYWTGTAFSATGNTAYGGQVGYAQRGNSYNWFAATAESGKMADTATTTDGNRIINGTVQDSICPKGWTLPVGGVTAINTTDGSVKSTYNLIQLYTGKTGDITNATVNTLYASPMNFAPSGHYSDFNGFTAVGAQQWYWSGTVASANSAAADGIYLNTLNNGTAGTGAAGGYKAGGWSIRCVAR